MPPSLPLSPLGEPSHRTVVESLLRDLDAYQASDEAEHRHREAMTALARGEDNPLTRRHFSPGHFTASAFVLSPCRSKLLLVLHSKFQRWLQPGGHIDADDPSPLYAAMREVEEEAGLGPESLAPARAGLFDLDVHPIPARGHEPAHHHFDLRFLLRAKSSSLAAGSDAHAARWVPLEEVSVADSDASVARAVTKVRQHLGRP